MHSIKFALFRLRFSNCTFIKAGPKFNVRLHSLVTYQVSAMLDNQREDYLLVCFQRASLFSSLITTKAIWRANEKLKSRCYCLSWSLSPAAPVLTLFHLPKLCL